MNVGGRNENEKNQGISHFLEHMIFKGTKKRSKLDIALEIESGGGMINAMTMKELTCFYAQILDENVGVAVDVLSDIVANSIFTDEEIAREKTVIIEEINAQEDTPDDLIFDYFYQELFPKHPLGMQILGTKETVSSFKADDLYGFIADKYNPEHIIIAAAGNLEHEHLLKLVEESFTLKNFSKSSNKMVLKAAKPKRKEWKRSISQAHIITGRRAFKYADKRKFPFFITNTLLGGGMSSRLFQNIRENFGYAYAIFSFNEALEDTGVWGVYIGTDREKIDDVLELTYKEYDRLRTERITEAELNRIKTQLKGNLMLGLESTSSRMQRLAKMEIYLKDFVTLDSIIEEIDKVTVEQVKDIAEELFNPKDATTVIFLPA